MCKSWTLLITLAAGCIVQSAPPPVGARPPQQPPGEPAPGGPGGPGSTGSTGMSGPEGPPPPPSGNPEVPIDPAKPMPADSMSTRGRIEPGRSFTAVVDGRADIYSSGLPAPDPGRGGKLPALLGIDSGGYVVFSNVKGVVGCVAGATTPADGGDCAGGNTDIKPANGISGIVDHQHTQFLVGVFLTAEPARQAPPTLDFSKNARGEGFSELAPQIGQTFYIGDGLTPTGQPQRFIVPPGATRLYLAFADAWSFQGEPGYYGDNTGGLYVMVTQQR